MSTRTAALRRALRPEWSNRNFDVLTGARVAMSVGRALAGIVTPIYLALEGFDALELSYYVLVVALVTAILSSSIGLGADRLGRRPFLVATPLLTAAAGVVFAVTGSHPALFVLGAVGSFGRGAGAGAGAVGPYQPAESAFATDAVRPEARNAAFGRLAFGSSAGALIGGLLALLVPTSRVGAVAATGVFRPAFLAIAAVSAVAGLTALLLVEPDRPRRAGGGPPRRRALRLPRRSRWLLHRLWVTNGVNGIGIGMFGPFVTYWFYRRFGAGPGEIGVLFAVINAATMASTLTAAGLARRWGLVRTLTAVRLAQAALLVPMALAPSFAAAGAVYLVRMLVQRVGLPLRQSYVVGLADPEERAAVAALSNLPAQLTMAGSPLATGVLFEEVSLSLPFEISAVFQLANAAMFWAFFRRHAPEEERSGRSGGGEARPAGSGEGPQRPAEYPEIG
ncbi:MAG: MFS transporter [Acidimicrobiales bacterium]